MVLFFGVLFRYVAPFLMGVSMAAAAAFADAASITAMLAAASLWFFSNSMPALR
jgi:hypothetical protein